MIRIRLYHRLKVVAQLIRALVLDLQLGLGVVLAVPAVDHGAQVDDAVLGLYPQHRPDAPPVQGDLHPRVLRLELQRGLVDLHQLRVELHHELERLRADAAGRVQDREALVLGQGLELQLLRLRREPVLQRDRQDLPLLRGDLPEVEDLRVHGEHARQHARPHPQVHDLAPLRRRPPARVLPRLRGVRAHEDRQLPRGVHRALLR
mmetsp:Transcript_7548/g.21112  ORF Transcript_7548/g.21112 Transcript_7548/m.21112 type:complete len:205 (+) Transcript_7548:815-1429(+)